MKPVTGYVFSMRACETAKLWALEQGFSAKVAEFAGQIAGFRECFKSTVGFARQLSVSDRTIRRYLQILRIHVSRTRIAGDNMPTAVRDEKTRRQMIRQGNRWTKLAGEIGKLCQELGKSAWNNARRIRAAMRAREREAGEQWRKDNPAHAEPPRTAAGLVVAAVAAAKQVPKREPAAARPNYRRAMSADEVNAAMEAERLQAMELQAAVSWDNEPDTS